MITKESELYNKTFKECLPKIAMKLNTFIKTLALPTTHCYSFTQKLMTYRNESSRFHSWIIENEWSKQKRHKIQSNRPLIHTKTSMRPTQDAKQKKITSNLDLPSKTLVSHSPPFLKMNNHTRPHGPSRRPNNNIHIPRNKNSSAMRGTRLYRNHVRACIFIAGAAKERVQGGQLPIPVSRPPDARIKGAAGGVYMHIQKL